VIIHCILVLSFQYQYRHTCASFDTIHNIFYPYVVYGVPDFDAILLETTGLTDPVPIVYTIQNDSELSENFFIDNIVCLADAKHVTLQLDGNSMDGAVNEAMYRQLALADTILLNKIDLVTPQEKAALTSRLTKINKFASVVETVLSRTSLDKILGLNSFDMEAILAVDPECFESPESVSNHNSEIVQTIGIQIQGQFLAKLFNIFMIDLVRAKVADLYRYMGVLSYHGHGDTKFVFQGVHDFVNVSLL
jgi:G3E family GTPase